MPGSTNDLWTQLGVNAAAISAVTAGIRWATSQLVTELRADRDDARRRANEALVDKNTLVAQLLDRIVPALTEQSRSQTEASKALSEATIVMREVADILRDHRRGR